MSHPVLSILIPAAGASKRLGQAKQLVKYKGITLIQSVMNVAHSIAPLEIIVVTGANSRAVRDAVQHPPARWIHNPNWSEGMGGSIALGAAAISPESSGLMIFLCDQYGVGSNDLQDLVKTWQSDPERIVAAEAEGNYMPPVIFPPSCIGQLRQLKGSRGAHSLIDAHPDLVTLIPMKNATFDLDTLTQLKKLKKSPDDNRRGSRNRAYQ